MRHRLIPALCLCFLIAPAWAQQEPVQNPGDTQQTAQADVPEQILIVGKKPGPGLWKVSKGDHVLWIFGSYSPLPKKMEWRSQEVETILAQSQEYLLPPSASATVGFFRQLTLLPFAIGFKKNPDGATLRDLLPADVYQRWQVLKQKYIGDDEGIERERPIFVADELYRKGLAHAGLTSGSEVRNFIENLVKKNKIKITSPNIKLPVNEPVKMLRDFKKSPMDDVACFSKTLERLETDLNDLGVRANAWAKGDLETIRKLNFADREEACSAALANSTFVKNQPDFQSVELRMSEAWLAAAEKSLETNASTFAMLPIKSILGGKSLVAALEAKGYTVQNPD